MDSRSSSVIPEEMLYEDKQRHQAYKELIIQISDSLEPSHVEKIVYLCELPEKMKQHSSLHVLQYLHQKKGSEFKEGNVEALIDLLKNISKEELISNRVEPYKLKFCGPLPLCSTPDTRVVSSETSSGIYFNAVYDQSHYQENALFSGGKLPTISSNSLEDDHTNPGLESCVGSISQSVLNAQSPAIEKHVQCTTDDVNTPTKLWTSGKRGFHGHRRSRPSLGICIPQRKANYQSLSSTQSLPHHVSEGYKDFQSAFHLEYPSHHNKDSQQSIVEPSLLRPQSATGFSPATAQMNERREVKPSPSSNYLCTDTSQWYNNFSSVDSIQDHHASYSSGFASSGEMLHHPSHYSRRVGLPPKPHIPFKDIHHDRLTSQAEYSQSSFCRYPVRVSRNTSSVSDSSGENQAQSKAYAQSSQRPMAMQGSEYHSLRSSFCTPKSDHATRNERSDYTTRNHSESRFENAQTQNYDSFSEVGHEFCPSTVSCCCRNEHCKKMPQQCDMGGVSTSQQRYHNLGSVDTHNSSEIGKEAIKEPHSTFGGKFPSQEKIREHTLANGSGDIQLPAYNVASPPLALSDNGRHRSSSLDQKQHDKAKKLSRLSGQFSSGTVSLSSAHSGKSSKKSYCSSSPHDFIESSFSDNSLSATSRSPEHKLPYSEVRRCQLSDVCFGVRRIPKSYHKIVLIRTHALKPQEEIEWKEKLHHINKLIYNHKHIGKYLLYSTKIAVIGKDGLKIVIQLRLHPFGVEEDENKNATVEIVVEHPKKRRLHSEAKLTIHISAMSEKTKMQLCMPRKEIKDANLSYFYIKGFISHEQLKIMQRSSHENVIVTVKAEMILPTM